MTKPIIALGIALAVAAPARAAGNVEPLQAVLDDLTALRDARGMRFEDPADAGRFARALGRLADQAQVSSSEEDCYPAENHRQKALELIRQRFPPQEWDAMITPLPRYLSTGETDYLQALIRRVHAAEIPDKLRAYFNHPPPFREGNKKAEFSIFLLERLQPQLVNACIELLPAYIFPSEVEPAKRLVTSTNPAMLQLELRRFFGAD